MPAESVLSTHSLKKYFGPVHAVEDVSLSVPRGQIYGFLGPNGAGKTTTIGMALGLLHATGGTVEIFGEPVTPAHNGVLRRVGALVGTPALVPYLSARRNLELVARLHPGLPRTRVDEVLALVGLAEAANRAAGGFSTGMKQRLGLAIALLHKPELLILDEPTNGMDPAGMREIRTLLRSLVADGTTVFLSSHLLHEVEQICDLVAVLNKGRVVAQGSVDSLRGGESVVTVRVPAPAEAARVLAGLPGVTRVQPNGATVAVTGVSGETVVGYLVAHQIVPSEVNTGRPDLESLFLELTQ